MEVGWRCWKYEILEIYSTDPIPIRNLHREGLQWDVDLSRLSPEFSGSGLKLTYKVPSLLKTGLVPPVHSDQWGRLMSNFQIDLWQSFNKMMESPHPVLGARSQVHPEILQAPHMTYLSHPLTRLTISVSQTCCHDSLSSLQNIKKSFTFSARHLVCSWRSGLTVVWRLVEAG